MELMLSTTGIPIVTARRSLCLFEVNVEVVCDASFVTSFKDTIFEMTRAKDRTGTQVSK
jgi:uncharacterized protein YkuJ